MSEKKSQGQPSTLFELLAGRAGAQGDARAYTFLLDGETAEAHLTYAELDRQARAIGAALQALSAKGERVLLLYPPGLDYVAAFFGCLYAGAVAVPAYPPRSNRPSARLAAIQASSGAKVVLTVAAVLAGLDRQLQREEGVEWLATDGALLAGAEAGFREPGVRADDLAFLQYTSGSTSTPKGVMLSHANLLDNLEWIRRSFAQTTAERTVIWLPPYHDMGLIGGILQPLYAGYPVWLMSPVAFLQKPLRWLQAISRVRGTTSGGPNFAYDLCAQKVTDEQRAALDLSSWTLAFNGAEPVRAETLDRFAAAFAPCGFRPTAFYPCYGLAEGTLLVAGGRRGDGARAAAFDAAELERHRAVPAAGEGLVRELVASGTVGGESAGGPPAEPRVQPRVEIVQPETGALCAAGEVGEIWVAGASVARGYWGRPEETAAALGARLAESGDGPFLRTGDLGFVTAEGWLYVTGRIKDLIIIRGRNHYPQDIELTVERSHPALRPGCGAAFAVEIDGEERLVVVQEVRREARNVDPAELIEAVRRAVAEEHELGLHAAVLLAPASIPKTSSGKIQRHACRAGFLAGKLAALGEWRAPKPPAGPAGPEEEAAPPAGLDTLDGVRRWLASEVAARVGVAAADIDPAQPISHYPLDSLNAMELMHAIEARLGVTVSMESFFEGLSLTELATAVLARAAGKTASVVEGTEGGAASPAPVAGHEAGEHRLSRGQQSLWFLHALDPGSAAYNVPNAVRIRGELDAAALLRSIQTLVDRHPALRTTFSTSRGEPVQLVHPRMDLEFVSLDAQGWSDARLGEHLARETHRPFDLEKGPLVRVSLFTRSAQEHVLHLTMHHIVTDFWSLGVLIDELAVLYPAFVAGESRELPRTTLLYTDYVRWQEEMLAGADGERLWGYWKERLSGELPVLDLTTDRPRPLVQTYGGENHPFRLSRELTARVKEVAREREATPFIALLAAFQALLQRHTRQDDLLVGSVTAARTRAGFARTIGYFVNPLVLRADLAGDPPFEAFLARARRDALGAFEHQEYPFPLLVEKLQPQRDPGRSPLFQVMFVLQKAHLADGQDLTACALGEPGARADVGGLRLEAMPLPQKIAQFDLTLTMGEVEGALVAALDYNTDLFDAATIARMARHFERLLEGAAADPRTPLSELPLVTETEARQLVAAWNDTRVEYPRDATLHRLFEEQAAKSPEAPAMMFGRERISYGELNERANRLAHHLRRLGVGPEVLTGICVDRSLAMMVGILGVLKAGGAYLPLDPDYPRERMAYILDDAGVKLLLTQERLRPLLETDPSPVERLEIDADWPAIAARPAGNPPPLATAGNLACVIYTSGSTGLPKGVLLDHRNVVNLVSSFLRSYEPGPEDRILPLTSIAYASFVGEIFPLLCAGGAVVLPDKHELLDVTALVGLIARHGVSMVSTVPSMMANLNALRGELPRLRLILVGGEALSAGDVDQLIDSVRIVNGYGLTETTICSTYYPLAPGDVAAGAKPAIGKPLMNHQVYVLDRHLQPLPIGCPGELYVAGEGLARAYLGNPALTAQRFSPDPFTTGRRMYRTGDLGRWRPDGNLLYMGRIDQQVKLRGYRIELGEVESVLALYPRVKEAFATVREDLPGDPRLTAYVVPAAEAAPPTAGELLAYLREKLPDYMVPTALVFLDALPMNVNGKVDRARLPVPDRARPELQSAYAAPRSEIERTITAVWQEALNVKTVGIDDNFFDLGGHSLLMAKVHARLKEELRRDVPLLELFQFPTISSLARRLSAGEAPAERPAEAAGRRARRRGETEIAIIGMSGRFPGAKDVPQLWKNLVAGREGITFFTAEELLAAGASPELVGNPNYVRAKGILGDVDLFDAAFFGLNPREVELMDPQHRLFLECAWEAMESAGWDPDRYPGLVGVYGGESMNTYMIMNLLSHMELVASVDTLQASLGNDKDPLTSRVSYKMNLKGPSITIQSASSTSLVAVHQACQSLINHDCDMALAGGVSIHLPETSGYMYQEGGTTSIDGHCRAFDAQATGFVSGHGAGVVLLKRLDEALADGDQIYAVIKGSACNNDGSLKVSFMAPSVDGQVEVYSMAYDNAGVDPATVSYIECHGTGTALGDPIEISALTRVFAAHSDRKGFCAIGSLKTNIGHLDTAAGVCGLIKAALALHHKTLPASLHFESPNSQIDFAGSPFFVNRELRAWETDGGPRRAGVTSLGMGGTNAHVVLEEAPPQATVPGAAASRPWQLLVLSAKSAAALESSTARLADHLRAHPELALPDVAYTLQTGRKAFKFRRLLVTDGSEDAATALDGLDPERLLTTSPEPGDRPVAFMFPGQGAQYVNMGRGLYASEPAFRDDVDLCCRLLEPHLGFDLRQALFVDDAGESEGEAAVRLQRTDVAQPALFVVCYATARLWLSWGVKPAAMIGHSIGEYVAACLAGVFSLADALALVAVRGRLMQQMPPGAMLGVPLPEAEVLPLVEGFHGELSLAAVNRPSVCVVSGPIEAVDELAARLSAQGHVCRRLHTSHAFHSRMTEPILEAFAEQVKRIRLEPPAIPYLSNVSGAWIRPEEATDPAYWTRQLRQAVRFADGIAALLAEPNRILLEVGPGNTLSTLARQHPDKRPTQAVVSSLHHPKEKEDDAVFVLRALGRLWLAGGEVDWSGFWAAEARRRVALPTYPFERRRYWVEPLREEGVAKRKAGRRRDPADWFYVPGWKQSRLAPATLPVRSDGSPAAEPASCLLFVDGAEGASARLGSALAAGLEQAGHTVTRVVAGDAGFALLGERLYRVAPGSAADYDALLEALDRSPSRIFHLWNAGTGTAAPGDLSALHDAVDRSFYSLLFLAQALGKRSATDPISLTVVSSGVQEITGAEPLAPERATLLGPCGVIPREYPNVVCRAIDVDLPDGEDDAAEAAIARIAGQILAEADRERAEPVVAFRGPQRWLPIYEPMPLPPASGAAGGAGLRPGGVCLITGGLGGLGLELALHLAREKKARLVLVGRSPFPERDRWTEWLAAHDAAGAVSAKIQRLLEIEALGAEVLTLSADVTDLAAMRAVRVAAERRFGAVHAILHTAGIPGAGLIQVKAREGAERVLAPKVRGALVLEEVFAGADLDFFAVTSSITALLPQIGQVDYVAANAFLDAFALRRARASRSGHSAVAIAWDAWKETGMAVTTEVPEELKAWRRESLEQGLASREGAEAFGRILASGLPQVVVSTLDFASRREQNERLAALTEIEGAVKAQESHPRPALANAYVAPETDLQKDIARVWQEILGIDEVGIHDNFFDLGGNSLAGLRVIQRMKERLQVNLSEVSLYEAPTVGALARLIAGAAEGEAAPVFEQSRSRGERRKARLAQKRGAGLE